MNVFEESDGVWFVYDGACPLCTSAAQAFRIKGSLHLINARKAAGHPLIDEINRRGLDLDEGMAIYARGRFYHGKDALAFMARYGDGRSGFTALCKGLFGFGPISSLAYPWLRGIRNRLLRQQNAPRIDNLNWQSESAFKSIFGDSWDDLPLAIKKHYANRPYTNDLTIMEGTLDVMYRGPIRIFSSLMKPMGQVPARNEKNVPVTAQFRSERDTKAFAFDCAFHFRGKAPYHFRSHVLPMNGGTAIEVMRFGLGWKMHYAWDGRKVVLEHRGHVLYLFGHFIPVPLTLLLGKIYAEQTPVDDNTFDMLMHIDHPWWGTAYEYKGRFRIIKATP